MVVVTAESSRRAALVAGAEAAQSDARLLKEIAERVVSHLVSGSDALVAAERAQQEAGDLCSSLATAQQEVEALRKQLADSEDARQNLNTLLTSSRRAKERAERELKEAEDVQEDAGHPRRRRCPSSGGAV